MMHVRNFRKFHVVVTPKSERGGHDAATQVAGPGQGMEGGGTLQAVEGRVCIVQKGLNLIVWVRDS